MSNIILIGYMGCGKSTLGKRLSYVLKQPYLDTDKMIEAKEKRSINAIFEAQGEAAFRDMETACVKSLFANMQDYVIAVGGGLPLREENRTLLRKLGKVIYLRAKPETIYERLKDDDTRPLLKGDNPRQKIAEMIAARGPVYEEAAHIRIDVDGKSFEELLVEIKEKIVEYAGSQNIIKP